VHLTPHEQERLLIHVAADVAEKRRARGLLLNYPETMALLTAHVFEEARDGKTVTDVMDSGRQLLTRNEVMAGVPEMIDSVQVEATFPDGTKLVTLHNPIPEAAEDVVVHPGKVEHPQPQRKADCPVDCDKADSSTCCDECDDSVNWHASILFNVGLQGGQSVSGGGRQPEKKTIKVRNTADRPIQVGSHYHFAEVNPGLKVIGKCSGATVSVVDETLLECVEAKGRRLNIPAGTSVRFEPTDECWVELVEFRGQAKDCDVEAIRGLRQQPVTPISEPSEEPAT
jgi:urease subunit gamma/beta